MNKTYHELATQPSEERQVKALTMRYLPASILIGLGLASLSVSTVYAEGIVADSQASAYQQPVIIRTGSGVTQVNIQAPSAAGVSMNQYQQFDVGNKGAVLANNRKASQTQIAGWVDANPNMARGGADVIVNQVNSNQASQLNGYVEVAGKRADVIIANPSGITVNGGGILNANKAILSTGQTQVKNGRVTGHEVSQGTITINGKGLDVRDTDYTAILARSAAINAGIYQGKGKLDVITGVNHVDNVGKVTKKANTSKTGNGQQTSKPQVAIDTGSLGGMYAGSIRLIGTEDGVGVNNAGQIQANQLTLSADGKLSNSGNMLADKLNIKTKNSVNSGTLSGQSEQRIATGKLDNSGTIHSGGELSIGITALENSGKIEGGRVALDTDSLSNTGKLQQTGTQGLSISMGSLDNRGLLGLTTSSNTGAGQAGGAGSAGKPTSGAGAQGSGTQGSSSKGASGSTTPVVSPTLAKGYVKVKGRLNSSGEISAGGDTDIVVGKNVRNSGQLVTKSLTLRSGSFENSGHISVSKADVSADSLDNRAGAITISQAQSFNFSQSVNNAGHINVGGAWSLDSQQLNNSGKISVGSDFTLKTKTVENSGEVLSAETLRIVSEKLTNSGQFNSLQALHLKSTALTNTTTGSINGVDLHLQAKQIDNAGDIIQSGSGNFAIAVNTLENQGQLGKVVVSGAGNTGSVGNQAGSTASKPTGTVSQSGAGGTVNQSSGAQYASNQSGSLDSQSVTNSGRIIANGQSDVQINDRLNNAGQLSVHGLQLQGELSNSGKLHSTSAGLIGQYLDNSGQLTAEQFSGFNFSKGVNNRGVIASSNGFAVTSQQLVNTGKMSSEGVLSATVTVLKNSGDIQSAKQLTINSQQLHNSGQLLAQEQLALKTKGLVNNGRVASDQLSVTSESLENSGDIAQTGQGNLSIRAGSVSNAKSAVLGVAIAQQSNSASSNNAGGTSTSGGSSTTSTVGSTSNAVSSAGATTSGGANPVTVADGTIAIAGTLNNSGRITGNGLVSLSSQENLVNRGQVNLGTFTLESGNLDNRQGVLSAQRMDLSGAWLRNQGGTLQSEEFHGFNFSEGVVNQGGVIRSQDMLTLESQGHIDNTEQGVISGIGDVVLRANSLTNDGSVVSGGSLSLDIQTALDNRNRLSAVDLLTTNSAKLSNGVQGDISAKRLIMSSGELINAGQLNQLGTGQLAISGTVIKNTVEGVLGALRASTVNSGSTSSTTGTVTSVGTTGGVTGSGTTGGTTSNSGSNGGSTTGTAGTAVQDGDGSITITGDIENSGKILANGQTQLLAGGGLTNEGTVNTQSLTLSGGDFTNSGLVLSEEATIDAKTLDNAGTLSASQFTQLRAETLNNSGKLIGEQSYRVDAKQVTNVGTESYVSSGNDLRIDSENLVNEGVIVADNQTLTIKQNLNNSGTVFSKKALSVDVDGDINNQSGKLLGQSITLSATDLKNDSGNIKSSSTLSTTLSGELQNTNNAIIEANDDIELTVGRLSQANKGLISSATGQLTIASTGQVTNDTSTLTAKAGLSLSSNGVNNNKGEVSSIGNLTITNGTAVLDNSEGRIVSNNNLSVSSGTTKNTKGQMYGKNIVMNTGDITNGEGKVVSTGNATINGKRIDNSAGLIYAGKDLSISTANQDLINRDTKAQGQGIAASGNLTIQARNIDNQLGSIGAQGNVRLSHQTSTAPSGRVVTVNNAQGTIESGKELTIFAQKLLNSAGEVYTKSGTINALHSIVNQAGKVLGGEGILNIVTKSFDNSHAGNVSADQLILSVDDDLDNRTGVISTNQSTITTGALSNQAGQIESMHSGVLTADILQNTHGKINSKGSLEVTTNSAEFGGTLEADKRLQLTVNGDYTNSGNVSAAGDLILNTEDFTNESVITAKNLTINAQDLENGKDAQLKSVNTTAITARGTIDNKGLIDGKTTLIQSNRLENSGRIYGNQVAVSGTSSMNNHDGGVIASREGVLHIATADLTNQGDALITSQGDVHIGRTLDADYAVQGTSDRIRNVGSRIESQGDMTIASSLLENRNVGFSYSDGHESIEDIPTEEYIKFFTAPAHIATQLFTLDNVGRCFKCGSDKNDGAVYSPFSSQPIVRNRLEYVYPSERYPFAAGYLKHTYALNEYKKIVNTNGGNVTYIWKKTPKKYAATDPAWRLFGVTPGNHDLLYAKLREYNQDYINRARRDFQMVYIKQRKTTQSQVDNAGKSAVISSGGNLILKGGKTINDNSKILVGKTLSYQDGATAVENVSVWGSKEVRLLGDWNQYSVEYDPYRTNHRGSGTYDQVASTESINLSTAEVEEHYQGGTTTAVDNNFATVRNTTLSGRTTNTVSIQAENADSAGARSVVRTNSPDSITVSDSRLFVIDTGSSPSGITGVALGSEAAPSVDVTPDKPDTGVLASNVSSPQIDNFSDAKNPLQSGSNDPTRQTPIVQTDPAFTGDKYWLSSDYLFDLMNSNPNSLHKRLGDGYYEQRLVNEQIGELTGRRFLSGYTSDDEQYKGLLTAGAEFAKKYNIRVGIALSTAQMQRLTTDIVWMVNERVTLPSGQVVTALVPKVYSVAKSTDMKGTGGLISANAIRGSLSEDLTNSGSMYANKRIDIAARNINNSGEILADVIKAQTALDFNQVGGRLSATTGVSIDAGRDVNLTSTTRSAHSKAGLSSSTLTQIDRESRINVGVGSNDAEDTLASLSIKANNNVNLAGAVLNNRSTNTTVLRTDEGDINFATVTLQKGLELVASARNNSKALSTLDVGSDINATGAVIVDSGNDVSMTASNINSTDGRVVVKGAGDVNVGVGRTTLDYESNTYSHKKKWGSSYTSRSHQHEILDDSVGSNITGKTVVVESGEAGDVHITGSNVVSDNGTVIKAGKDVTIDAAQDNYKSNNWGYTKKSGFLSTGGLGFTIGKQQTETTGDKGSVTHTGSMVGSVKEGNTTIIAGENYSQVGSVVNAVDGDVSVLAKQIEVKAAENRNAENSTFKFKQSGLTVSLSTPVTDAVMGVAGAAETMGKSKNGRVNAMAAANTAWQGYQAGKALSNFATSGNKSSGVSVSITYGKQKSESESHSRSTTAQASTINAGGKVNLIATGGDNSSITIIGSDVVGAKGTSLRADHDINLLAATETSSERSKNKSSGWNAGVAIDFSNGVAFGVTAGGNYGKGHGNGDSVIHRNTHVGSLTGQTVIEAGNQLALRGAQVLGKGVTVDADSLVIESLQDVVKYDSKQMNASAQVTAGYGFSANGSFSKSKANADHLAVRAQSGILAGADGFDVTVENHTDLIGGVITSIASAEQQGKNQFSTGTLSTSNLHNHSEYDAKGFALSGGVDVKGGWNGQTVNSQGQPINSVSRSVGYGSDSDSQNSTTFAGIGTSNITITDTAGQRDTQSALLESLDSVITTDTTSDVLTNVGLENRFDKAAVMNEINLQVAVTQQFDQTMQGVKGEFNSALDDLKKELDDKKISQSDYDRKRKGLETASLIVSGIGGALSTPNSNGIVGDLAQIAAPHVAKQIGDYFAQPGNSNKAAHGLAHTVLAAAVAAAGGNDALTAGLSAGGAELAAPVVSKWLYGETDGSKLTAEQKQTISNITSLIGTAAGATTGNVTDIASSTQAATNAVENNYLFRHEAERLQEVTQQLIRLDCSQNTEACQSLQKEKIALEVRDTLRDESAAKACISGSEADCNRAIANVNAAIKSYHDGGPIVPPSNIVVSESLEVKDFKGKLECLSNDSCVAISATGVLVPTVLAGVALTTEASVACFTNPVVCSELVADTLVGDATGGAAVVGGVTVVGKVTKEAIETAVQKSADDVAKGATHVVDSIPGLSRPIRGENPHYPANQNVVDYMNSSYINEFKSCKSADCSEIAEKLLDVANGKGHIIEVRPADRFGNISIFENGKIDPNMTYHQVYTDGRYVYDPRISNNPIPKGDWEQHIRGINKDKNLVFSNNPRGLQ